MPDGLTRPLARGAAHPGGGASGAPGAPAAPAGGAARRGEEAIHRIGPNAVTRLAEALAAADPGGGLAARVFAAAGCLDWLVEPPGTMVDERPVARLHAEVHDHMPAPLAEAVLRDAGRRTGAYILAHRIPAPARALLRALPAVLADRMLTAAIARHAWTFAGSGRFETEPTGPRARRRVVVLGGNPLALPPEDAAAALPPRPGCVWHAQVFETLYARLVHPAATARETACAADGAPACRFEITW